MSAPIPAVVVGTGFGCRIHVPALRASGFEVVGLVGSNPGKTEKRAGQNGISAWFTDLDEAITKTGAKVVTIATPPSTHAALTLKAIAHGCHVVCEKPFAFDSTEAQTMLDAAEQAGVFHMIDQIRAWLGEFDTLSANLLLVSDRVADCEDTYSMRFRMKSGVEGSMQQSAGAWGPMATMWRCAGTHGTVWTEQGKVMVADKAGARELPVPDDLALPPPPPADEGNAANRASHFEIGPFTRFCEALHAGIEGREMKSLVPVPTFRDGLASMQILDAMRASSAAGGTLKQV